MNQVGVSSVVDYVLARKKDMKDVKDVKVIPGEECVSQHKLVVMDMRIKRSTKMKAKGTRGKLKTWRLRSATEREEKIVVHGESAHERWSSWEHDLKNAAEKVCGRSKDGKKQEETWWWNEQVVEVIKRKKEGYKKWWKNRSEENLEEYKVLKKEARQEVASAMENRQIEMANELEKGGSTMAFRIAKQRAKEKRDIIGVHGCSIV